MDVFISVVESELMNAPEQRHIPSHPDDKRQALRSHMRNTEVVIREADKGLAVVVMSRERYIAEANHLLFDMYVPSKEFRHHRGHGFLCCSCRYKTGSFLHSPKGS